MSTESGTFDDEDLEELINNARQYSPNGESSSEEPTLEDARRLLGTEALSPIFEHIGDTIRELIEEGDDAIRLDLVKFVLRDRQNLLNLLAGQPDKEIMTTQAVPPQALQGLIHEDNENTSGEDGGA